MTERTRNSFGATPEEWTHFTEALGLTARVLPVVSNPGSEISGLSKMKGLGKTPSIYNRERKVAGLPKWTQRAAPSAHELKRWSEEPDYGLCIRTGVVGEGPNLVAIDMDSDDPAAIATARELIEDYLGPLPLRWREGSTKCLAAVQVAGNPLFKGVCHLKGRERIELLATGQQFVAAGTHTSGQRYQWEGGLPEAIPLVSAEAFDAFWQALNDALGVEPPSSSAERKRGERIDMADERLDWLESSIEHYGFGREGQLYIPCPFKDGHSSDSGETETCYFPAGTGGYERGHYVCLHASCSGRSDAEFDLATGYAETYLVELPAVVDKNGKELARSPNLERDKTGAIKASVSNLDIALRAKDWLGLRISHDRFLGRTLFAWDEGPWQLMSDECLTSLRIRLERLGFNRIRDKELFDCTMRVAREQSFDSAVDWVTSLQWDGIARAHRLMPDYFGTADTPYAKAVSLYWLTGQVARVMDPGHKCDMVPVLVSPEGHYKSSSVEALAPDPSYFVEINLAERDIEIARKMQGKLIGEIAELRGLQGRSGEHNKAWITARFDEYRDHHRNFATQRYRRLMFVGTTNNSEFINDATGGRRWLPIEVHQVDREAILRDRDQLWAEALVLLKQRGHVWWEEAYELGPQARENFRMHDVWEGAVERWLADNPQTVVDGYEEVTVEIVLAAALGLTLDKCGSGGQHRVRRVLRTLGFEKPRQLRRNGVRVMIWRRQCLSNPPA